MSRSRTLDVGELMAELALRAPGRGVPVRLIVGGVAYPIVDVWFEPLQDGDGAVCIGDDPR